MTRTKLIFPLGVRATGETTPNVLILGKLYPATKKERPIIATGQPFMPRIGSELLNRTLRTANAPQQLMLKDGTEVLSGATALLTVVDPAARTQAATSLLADLQEAKDAEIEELRKRVNAAIEAFEKKEEGASTELVRDVNELGPLAQTALAVRVMSGVRLREELRQMTVLLEPTTKAEVVVRVQEHLATLSEVNRNCATQVAEGISQYASAVAAADLYRRNAGASVSVAFLSHPDVEGWLASDPDSFLRMVRGLGSTHVDVVLLDNLQDPRSLDPVADAIGESPKSFLTIYAGTRAYRDVGDLLQKAQRWAPRESVGAGCIQLAVGKMLHLGHEVSMAAAMAGLRHRLDGMLQPNNHLYGQMEPGFGFRAPKRLNAVQGVDSFDWEEEALTALAALGINAAYLDRTTGNVGMWSARSRSALENYLFTDQVRLIHKLVGRISRFLASEGIGGANSRVRHEYLASKADDMFIQPVRGCAGFDGRVGIVRGTKKTPKLDFEFEFERLVPVEAIEAEVRFRDSA